MTKKLSALFIGGSGVISSACAREAIRQNIDLSLLTRGKSNEIHPLPEGAKTIFADIRNFSEAAKALDGQHFDVVVDWISFLPSQLESNMNLLKGKVGQYVFISSASAYQIPIISLPTTERTPLDNPIWEYSQNKIACEKLLISKAKALGFDYTIVRPSHTYDQTVVPIKGGYNTIDRMKRGVPVVIFGDGTSLWTLTNHRDFAVGLVGLLGNSKALNEDFHITSDEWLTWNHIFDLTAEAFGTKAIKIHVPSEVIAQFNKEMGDSILGDKMHCRIFDNSKIKAAVPEFQCKIKYAEGAKEIAAWYNADSKRQIINKEQNEMWDRIITDLYTNILDNDQYEIK